MASSAGCLRSGPCCSSSFSFSVAQDERRDKGAVGGIEPGAGVGEADCGIGGTGGAEVEVVAS